jgi:transposase
MSKVIRKSRMRLKKTKDDVERLKEEHPDLKVMFFDEGRFGLHSTLTRVWGMRGKPLTIKVRQGYTNFYAYSAIEPSTGDSFSLFLPWVNTEMMNLYFQHMKAEYPEERILLIMDQAGWHRSCELQIPEGIELVFLPPYSPELNPVERYWKALKQAVVHNRLYEKLEDMMSALAAQIKDIPREMMMQLCHCSYL